MREIKEYEYPHQKDKNELMSVILNSTSPIPESYKERSENCHIAEEIESSPVVQKFINWIEETTNTKLKDIWGVWYNDGGGIKWHTHKGDFRYSFAYYIQVPEGSSSIYFSEDPETTEPTFFYANQGICVVWDSDFPHCVPPSNHEGRCVLSGNLR
tara:strand:+ start:78 stop:545 length:468 start_codon:yes stop_codon:yes gene_type:complete